MPKNVSSRKISLQFQQNWNYNQHQSLNPQPQGAKSRPLSRDIRLPTQHRELEGGQITVPAQPGGQAYGYCSHSTLGWGKSHRAQGDTLPAGRWIHRDGTPERQPGRRASQNWEAPLERWKRPLKLEGRACRGNDTQETRKEGQGQAGGCSWRMAEGTQGF